MEPVPVSPANPDQSRMRSLWMGALFGSFVVCVLAAFRAGYIGPDYFSHLMRCIEWPKIFDFSTTNPPIYFLAGHGLWKILGDHIRFPITLSIIQIVINTVALGWFLLYSERWFRSSLVHAALALFLIFLPVRMIHSATLGTDCMTIPAFVLVSILLDRLLADKGLTITNAIYLGAALLVAVGFKYTFMALLPVILAIFIVLSVKRGWRFQNLAMVVLISLGAATTFSLASFWLSHQVHGYNTEKHWRPITEGVVRDMNFIDLVSIKSSDAWLFSAPECFKRYVAIPHEHGYLALAHYGIFTDPMNLFQRMTVPETFGAVLIPDQKDRAPWKTRVMIASMLLGVVWTLSAVIGTLWALRRAVQNLARGRLEPENTNVLLGTAFFLLIFLPIPFVYGAVLFGYWTPRLILPALLAFSVAAFLFIEEKFVRGSQTLAFGVLALVIVQAAFELMILA